MKGRIPPFHKLILIALSLVCLFYGFRNYNALLNSDQYSYLSFARALSHGSLYQEYPLYRLFSDRLAQGESVNLHYGTRNYRDGKVYSGLPIGFPLLLAAALTIGGLPGVFAVNILLLPVFLIFYYLAVRELFDTSPNRDRIALFCVVMILSMDQVIFPRYSLMLMRDLSSVTFFWIGLFFLLTARRRPFKTMTVRLVLASAALAFASSIRLTNGVMCFPVLLYGLIHFGREIGWKKVTILLSGLLLLFLLVFSPVLLENYSFNKDPLVPFKYASQSLYAPQSLTGRVLFSPAFFIRHFPANLEFLYDLYTLVGASLLVVGIVAFRRRAVVWLILIPIPILHLLIFSLFEEDFHRYLIPLYPFLTALAGAGAVEALFGLDRFFRADGRWKFLKLFFRLLVALLLLAWATRAVLAVPAGFGWPLFFTAIAGIVLLLPAGWRMKIFSPPVRVRLLIGLFALVLIVRLGTDGLRSNNFGLNNVDRLRSEVESVVSQGSIVWGTRYLIQNIDFYTRAWGVDPAHLQWPFSLTLPEVTERILEARVPLFIFDNKGLKSATHYLFRLGRNFDLEKVKSWEADDLALRHKHYSRNEVLNLYRVRPWKSMTVELDLPTTEKKDYLLTVDLKDADLSFGEGRIFVDRTELPVHLVDGMNFIHLPAYLVEQPRTTVRVVSDNSPISGDIFLDLRPADRGYLLQAGKAGEIQDYLFLEKGFHKGPTAVTRGLSGTGVIRVPVYSALGHRSVLKLKVRNESDTETPLNLRLELNGAPLAEFKLSGGAGWQVLQTPLPLLGGEITSFLTLTVEGPGGKEGAISLEWVEVEQLPLPPSSILSRADGGCHEADEARSYKGN